MKKHEIYVPIANKKEAKRAKAVLEAMGEKVDREFYLINYNQLNGGLYFNEEFKTWCIAVSFGGSNPNTRTKITLKQLIELIVSEQNDKAKSAVEEKIAVRVDNEKEFNALMKYYDSLGYKWVSGDNPVEIKYNSHIHSVRFENFFGHASGNFHEIEGYKIIPFSDFAKEHGIRVPLLVSEDGVELFEGSEYHSIWKSDSGVWNYDEEVYYSFKNNDTIFIKEPNEFKAFSTKQAALDWIEAQKPKSIRLFEKTQIPIEVYKDFALLKTNIPISGIKYDVEISKEEVHAIHKAMEELNS